MADRSHLIPVRTTDRRGRATTVYRNLGAKPAPAPRTPFPAAPAVLAPEHRERARLPEVAIRSREEIVEFGRTMDRWLKFMAEAYSFSPQRWDSTDSTGIVAMSLAMDLTESGALDVDTAAVLLSRVKGDKLGGLGCDVLRIGARLWPNRAERPDGTDWCQLLCPGVAGLYARGTAGPGPITTAEDLESCAAVVRFLMNTAQNSSLSTLSDLIEDSTRVSTRVLRNKHLDALIRERPADLDRIVAYITERSMDPVSSAPVEDLRDWLDTDTPALGDGWL
ncbi:hypothetical protein ACX801_07845 [Arthrobacter bambusae]